MPDNVTIPPQTLVVVADGHHAILLRSHGVKDGLTLTEEERLTPQNLGKFGPSGSRPDEQTPRQTDEATFANQLSDALYTMKQAQKFDHMLLVADPQTLGQMRDTMHKSVSASIIISLDKELSNHSTSDIAAIIRKAAG